MSLGLRALQLGAGNEAKPSANAYHLPFETEAKDEVGMQTQVLQQEHPINGASLRYPPPAGRTELRGPADDMLSRCWGYRWRPPGFASNGNRSLV